MAAGFTLQIDDPFLTEEFSYGTGSREQKLANAQRYVAAINRSLHGIPRERVRLHTCYGINEGPRLHDAPLADLIETLLTINAGALSFEAANPRHEHCHHVFESVPLPPGTVLLPGVISHATNIVEHPDTIADRIVRFAELVGRRRSRDDGVMRIEERLTARGLVLPAPMEPPAGMALPFPWVRLWPNHRPGRAFVSGHGPLLPDGSIPESLLGKVGADVSETDAYEAARLTGLAILASLQRALGDLDRVTGWLRVFGMVNAAPGFTRTPAVINGFSDLIVDLWGPEAGAHARSAIGVAELPLGIPVEIEAEVAVD